MQSYRWTLFNVGLTLILKYILIFVSMFRLCKVDYIVIMELKKFNHYQLKHEHLLMTIVIRRKFVDFILSSLNKCLLFQIWRIKFQIYI